MRRGRGRADAGRCSCAARRAPASRCTSPDATRRVAGAARRRALAAAGRLRRADRPRGSSASARCRCRPTSGGPTGRRPRDRERYQTIFARAPGAVAAPTAGLHFTPALLAALAAVGRRASPRLTLHVGPGTFLPIRGGDLDDHAMAAEAYESSAETAARGSRRRAPPGAGSWRWGRRRCARSSRRRPMRPAASAAPARRRCSSVPGIASGSSMRLLTNFHLPRSPLLALVAALAGWERSAPRTTKRSRRALSLLQLRRRDADRVSVPALRASCARRPARGARRGRLDDRARRWSRRRRSCRSRRTAR